ncbi:uncharacterized protein LOC119674541 [Teleopsis dalmanni]|uniref:uncharacterized protein LOC119674541 n=1 Tax=Teleopsis dalmanni TaxID=139649 RepID=UPI0018CEF432|nr:uncharacterized protein LOC119674541 [Teleopsis dalmanni]
MSNLFWILFLTLKVSSALNQTENKIMTKEIESFMSHPLSNIAYINIILRSDVIDDNVTMYVHWFFEHFGVPKLVSTYTKASLKRESTLGDTKLDAERESFIIHTNIDLLKPLVEKYVQRADIVIFILSDDWDMDNLHKNLYHIWTTYNIFKTYILSMNGMFFFNPFEYNNAVNRYGKVIQYSKERRLDLNLLKDLQGYPLRIQIFKSVYARPVLNKQTRKIIGVDGVDGRVADLLQKRLNFTMKLQEPDPNYFGERQLDGTYNGAIGSIIKKEIDLCLTGFFIKDYMVPELDFTVAVYDDMLCIYVPKAKPIPSSILPLFSVRSDLWIGFILTAFICAFIWAIMRRINLWLNITSRTDISMRSAFKFQFLRILIDTWVVWVRVNILRYPPFNSERIYIASLCLVSVIFGAIFESSLATVYIHPIYYKDIKTLRELDQSGLKVIYKYSSFADDLFFSETSPLFANLNRKLTHLSNLNADVTLDIAQNGGKSGVTRYTSLMLESLHFVISKQIWIVPECPKYYTISYVMPQDSPWEEGVNDLLLRFQSSGLINKWIQDMKTEVNIKVMKMNQFQSGNVFKVLTIKDLQLSFYVVLVGNLLSGVSFLVEKFVLPRYRSRNKN